MRKPRVGTGKGGARGPSLAHAGIAATAALAVGVPVALAINPLAGHARARAAAAPSFTLHATPSARTITPGQTVRYQIKIRRARKFRRSVSLITIGGLPSGSHAKFTPKATTGSGSTLSVSTISTKTGRYRVRVRGVSGSAQNTISITLVLSLPPSPPFAIGGSVGDLHPGSPAAVNLTLTNPSSQTLGISSLSVSIQRITAPNATAALPCTISDFSIRQFAGSLPLVVAPRSARTLAQLGVPAAQWPQVTVLDRRVDQDGCKGASLTLTYRGGGLYG
jgi:hypothetical protein